jgi:DNA (cytosine-5)-methyltransferase 1
VAQRRRRVFVVGCLGDWRSAAEVLFEPESLRGNPAPSREKRKEIAGTLEASLGRSRGAGTPLAAIQPYTVANCLTQRMHKGINTTLDEGQTPVISIQDVTPREKAQNGRGWNAPQSSEVTQQIWAVMQATAFHENQRGEITVNDTVGALKVGGGKPGQGYPAVALTGGVDNEMNGHTADEPTGPLLKGSPTGGGRPLPAISLPTMQVRRLTPVECERLQGFPDGYTNIPWRGKPESPDGPRYKALGNSMAIPVMRWIGQRIDR